jgi:hypothetical protein
MGMVLRRDQTTTRMTAIIAAIVTTREEVEVDTLFGFVNKEQLTLIKEEEEEWWQESQQQKKQISQR